MTVSDAARKAWLDGVNARIDAAVARARMNAIADYFASAPPERVELPLGEDGLAGVLVREA